MLLKHQPYDNAIGLQEGAQSAFGPIYNLSQNKPVALKNYIEKNLTKNFIQHSKSLTGAPIVFVKKRDGFL